MRQAFSDNLERPLAALLKRLAAPSMFEPAALQFPAFVFEQIIALLEGCMDHFRKDIAETEYAQTAYAQAMQEARAKHPAEDLVISLFFTSLREFRKYLARICDVDAHVYHLKPSILPLDVVLDTLKDPGFGCQRQTLLKVPSMGSYGVGLLIMVKLDDFTATPLTDTFAATACTDLEALFHVYRATTPAYLFNVLSHSGEELDAARRELEELSRNPLLKDHEDARLACAVCLKADAPLNRAARLQLCAGCGAVAYCGKEHQREHWRTTHKAQCKALKQTLARQAQLKCFVERTIEREMGFPGEAS